MISIANVVKSTRRHIATVGALMILWVGIDDDAALLVRKNSFEVIGAGRVAIYDNVRRNGPGITG